MGKAEELAKRLRELHLAATYEEALTRAQEMLGEEPTDEAPKE